MTHKTRHTCGGQRMTCRSQFSSFNMCLWGHGRILYPLSHLTSLHAFKSSYYKITLSPVSLDFITGRHAHSCLWDPLVCWYRIKGNKFSLAIPLSPTVMKQMLHMQFDVSCQICSQGERLLCRQHCRFHDCWWACQVLMHGSLKHSVMGLTEQGPTMWSQHRRTAALCSSEIAGGETSFVSFLSDWVTYSHHKWISNLRYFSLKSLRKHSKLCY